LVFLTTTALRRYRQRRTAFFRDTVIVPPPDIVMSGADHHLSLFNLLAVSTRSLELLDQQRFFDATQLCARHGLSRVLA
jgi:hypothetical protein